MNLSLYIHIRTGLLLQSSKVNSQVSLPALYRQDSVALRIQFVDDNPTGGYTTPLQIVPVDALSIRVGIGDPGTPLALQATWARDTVNDWFTGQLDLNTTELNAAFGGGNPTLKKIFEVELVDSGTQRQTYQYAVTIKPDVIRNGAPDPEDYDPPSALVDNLGSIFVDSDDVTWLRDSETYTVLLKYGAKFVQNRSALTGLTGGGSTKLDGITTAANAQLTGCMAALVLAGQITFYQLVAGAEVEAAPDVVRPDDYDASTNARVWKRVFSPLTGLPAPAPDGLVPQLRLESPFGGAGLTVTNTEDTNVVTAGGTAQVTYVARFRIRGAVETRSSYDGDIFNGLCCFGGSAPSGAADVWALEISSPAQTIYLNYGPADFAYVLLDYVTPPVQINAGATVTLRHRSMDGLQGNASGLIDDVTAPVAARTPFIQVDQVQEDVKDMPRFITPNLSSNTGALDFLMDEWVLFRPTGDLTLTASNMTPGRAVNLLIQGGGTDGALTFPAWTWLNRAAPAKIKAGEWMRLRLECTGTTAGSVLAQECIENGHSAATLTIVDDTTDGTITLPSRSVHHLVEVSLTEPGSGGSPYTTKLILDTASPWVRPGALINLRIALPATGVTAEIRNATSSGTTLLAFASDGTAEVILAAVQFNGTAWKLLYPDAQVIGAGTGGSPPATEDDCESLGNITGAISLDLSTTPYAQATPTGNLTLGITNGSGAGKHRGKTLYLAAPGSDLSHTFAGGIISLVSSPWSQPTGKAAVVTLTDRHGTKTAIVAVQP